jgi:hypothetical protein
MLTAKKQTQTSQNSKTHTTQAFQVFQAFPQSDSIMKLNILFLSAAALLINAATAEDGPLEVKLEKAGNYVILAKTGISTVPNSVITGDIGVSPIKAAAMTGFSMTMHGEYSTSTQLTGKAFASDYDSPTPKTLLTAVSDMETAYSDTAGLTDDNVVGQDGEIGGKTLAPGLHDFGGNDIAIGVATEVTFSGSASDVFILQTSGSMKQAADTKVILSKGAKAENIFWQVAGGVEVGAGAHLEGVILAMNEVTFITGSSLTGRVLTQKACVLQKATITEPV